MTSELPVTHGDAADRAIQQVDATEPVAEMAAHARELARGMIERGDRCPTGEDADTNDLKCQMTHFVWAQRAKHFLMLYRDVQLQLQIATLMAEDGQSDKDHVARLYQQSREALSDAHREWEADHETHLTALQRNDRQRRRQLAAWKLQHNPWPVYRQQLGEIADQSERLAAEYQQLTTQAARFVRLRELLRNSIEASGEIMNQAGKRADDIVSFIREDSKPSSERPGVIAAKLDDYLTDERVLPRLDRFTNAVTAHVAGFSEQQRVTLGSDQGILKYKEVNFRKSTDQWVSSEVMPLLYELWELSQQHRNGLNVAIVNVRNRALLLANEMKAGQEVVVSGKELAQPFAAFLRQDTERREAYDRIRRKLEAQIERDLHLSSVYRAVPGFLPLPLQSGINAFTRRQGRLLTGLRKWVGRYASGLSTFIGEATREERLSLSERTVRVIRQRTVAPNNAGYTNILMTKGYIGESFLVGRDEEIEHLRQLVESWRLGFRGSVILTGDRLAGKTLFGELVTNRFFAGKTIRLRPNTTITVAGRRLTTTGDLGEALAFVQKYTVQQRPLVWIDDLELWWDKDRTLGYNVRALSDHIDDYSGRIFYLVSTSNAVYRHLDRFVSLDKVFQSRIGMDRFSLDDMQRAVLIRHGATHRSMVDAEGEPVSEASFAAMVKRLYRATNGNVGDTINRWAYYTERYGEESVRQPQRRRYSLPPFLNPDTATLLATLILEKRSRDYRLRRLFGPAYQERYGSILQRLIRIGVVRRNGDGTLEIAESIVNDVGRMLAAEDYLHYGN